MSDQSEDLSDRLYGLPREEFVAARDALARELRARGDLEGARRVGGLRKPSVPAWAINRVARDRAAEVEELIRVGEDLGALQRGGRGSREDLRRAMAARRRLVDGLVAAAERALREAGGVAGRAHLDRVAATLEAVATDPRVRDLVRRGRLEREVAAPSEFGEALPVAPAEARRGSAASPESAESRPAARAAGAGPKRPRRRSSRSVSQ